MSKGKTKFNISVDTDYDQLSGESENCSFYIDLYNTKTVTFCVTGWDEFDNNKLAKVRFAMSRKQFKKYLLYLNTLYKTTK